MKELTVISGKGGTGKTSIVGSFAMLAENAVLADCDVDAADLHLILKPEIVHRQDFTGGNMAEIIPDKCRSCGQCEQLCKFDTISFDEKSDSYVINPIACEGCGVCAWFCPAKAIELSEAINGEWFISNTRGGPMIHAKLGIAADNSGKLVSTVREAARKQAEKDNLDTVIIDGSPGTGCPVIASITGVDLVLIVTEPTLSGLHDLDRVAKVAKHFEVPAMACVNKWDINPEITEQIESHCNKLGLQCVGRVRYDKAVTQAQIRQQAVVEFQTDGCASDIREIWSVVKATLADQ